MKRISVPRLPDARSFTSRFPVHKNTRGAISLLFFFATSNCLHKVNHKLRRTLTSSGTGVGTWPTWLPTTGELASTTSDETESRVSSGGGLGGNTEVSNFFINSAASVVVEESPLACPFVVGIFKTPVLSEILFEEALIRREIRTLGVLASKEEDTIDSKKAIPKDDPKAFFTRDNKSFEIAAVSHFR